MAISNNYIDKWFSWWTRTNRN